MTLKRKRAKPRARGTGCQLGRRCIAVGEYREKRVCAKHMADWMMADAVKAEEGCCRKCGSQTDLQWSHVHSRRYMATRWDRANSMALCRTHHFYFTANPLRWEQWCRDVDVPWDALRMVALGGEPMDPLLVIEQLRDAA